MTPSETPFPRVRKVQRQLCALLFTVALSSCTTLVALPPYVASPTSQIGGKAIDLTGVELGPFVSDNQVQPICRGGWAKISPGPEKDFESYIRHAVAQELGRSNPDVGSPPRVKLTGHIERLEFSSTPDWLRSGYWDIRLRIDSTNGRTLTVEQKRLFETGYHDVPACEKVAAQFPVTVRALIESLVANPGFPPLLK